MISREVSYRICFITIIAFLCISLTTACSSRSITKPRSEVIEEADDNGMVLPSIEMERQRFYEEEEVNKKRLMTLIRKRSSGSFRNSSYRVGAGDEIEVNVFDVEELNKTVRVRQSGMVTLPLVGAVRAAGLTEQEFRDSLDERLRAFVREPELTVFISHYGSQKVAVLGAIRNSGSYPLKKGSNSILELISEAGGLTKEAGNYLNFVPAELSGLGASNNVEARARLALASFEKQDLAHSAIEIVLDQVLGTSGGIPLEIPVRGGDMIIIPEGGTVTVEGEVELRGSYELGRRMTLLGALASAGGITYSAKVDEVEIVRDNSLGQKVRLITDLGEIATGTQQDVRLKSGDVIRVPSHSGRRLQEDTFEGITQIINFGIGGTIGVP